MAIEPKDQALANKLKPVSTAVDPVLQNMVELDYLQWQIDGINGQEPTKQAQRCIVI